MKLSEKAPFIHPNCDVMDTDFGRYTEVGMGTRLAHSALGDYSYCDRFCDISNAQIGKFSNIASYVRIGATDHPLNRASLHHFMYRSSDYWPDAAIDENWFAKRKSRTTHIGHDTWIGHNAQIKPDVSIGHGAVVASGAIMTKDVAPYTIVSGIPAQPMRLRQPVEIAQRLVQLAWWDWPHDAIRETLEDFRSLSAESFLQKYEA